MTKFDIRKGQVLCICILFLIIKVLLDKNLSVRDNNWDHNCIQGRNQVIIAEEDTTDVGNGSHEVNHHMRSNWTKILTYGDSYTIIPASAVPKNVMEEIGERWWKALAEERYQIKSKTPKSQQKITRCINCIKKNPNFSLQRHPRNTNSNQTSQP